MAKMYPSNISNYLPTDSESAVYYQLKIQLPDNFEVFYSISWSEIKKDKLIKSEADFIILDPEQGFICLEVKGGRVRVENGEWYVSDSMHGERHLNVSPYNQAENSMYYFRDVYANKYNYSFNGAYGAGVVFPFTYLGEDVAISNRDRECTIDKSEMNDLYKKIKRMFRIYSGERYGSMIYTQHKLFSEMLKENLAIEASSGALVEYKERELNIINRVQDNYVYLLKGMKQFLMRGGAGTGKTWIAMKMAANSALQKGSRVLLVCVSKPLSLKIKEHISSNVLVYSLDELFRIAIEGFSNLIDYDFSSERVNIRKDFEKFDSIYVDEAQDFKEEWARMIVQLLRNQGKSRLGVFYDEVQILRNDSFGDGFGKNLPLFYLNENIRNTSSIYDWASKNTNLGKDVISNPVEGPEPQTEFIQEKGQLTQRLEMLFKRFLEDERLPNTAVVILVENVPDFLSMYSEGIAKWSFSCDMPSDPDTIQVSSVADFKGQESNMVIYIHSDNASRNLNYIAYTRAKFYLLELVWRG